MSGFTPLLRAQFRTILVNQFQASLTAGGVALEDMPDTGPDSVMGAAFDAFSAALEQEQYQAQLYQLTSRLATTPANADGTVSPDAASFAAPFGITPAPGSYATSKTFSLNLNSVNASASTTIPCGVVILRSDGLQYVLIADATQPAYNGSQGYTIPANTLSVLATAICLTQGTPGNVADPTAVTWAPYVGPGAITAPALGSVSNGSPITTGASAELQTAFAARFTLAMQNGQWAVKTAIIAKALGVQAGLIVSYGNTMNADGSYHQAYITLVVNVQGSATAPSSGLITSITTALMPVVGGGIEFQVIGPTPVTPTITGNIAVRAGYTSSVVKAGVQTAVQSLINGTTTTTGVGLDQNGGTTTLSYAQTLATMIAVPGVNPAGTTLEFNGGTADIVAAFANQIVAPTAPAFTTS